MREGRKKEASKVKQTNKAKQLTSGEINKVNRLNLLHVFCVHRLRAQICPPVTSSACSGTSETATQSRCIIFHTSLQHYT